MRRNLTLFPLLAVFLMLLPMVAFGAAGDGLRGSAHDMVKPGHAGEFGFPVSFTSPSKSTESRTYDPSEVIAGAVGLCAICHTPHNGIQTSLLWNHTLSANSFSWSDANQTVGGTPLPSDLATWAGSSKLCLSCHDGSVAIGDLAWYQGAIKTGDATPPIYPTQKVSGGADNTVDDNAPDKYIITGAAGDMKGNHPVGIPYPLGGVVNTYASITTGAGVVMSEFVSDPTTTGIRLYKMSGSVVTAIGSGYAGTDVGMECGSCHDPHNGPTVKADLVSGDDRLVRGTVYGDGPGGSTWGGVDDDYLCVKCHNK